MATTIMCMSCGHEQDVILETPDREEMTGEEYAQLHRMAGLKLVCDECLPDR